MAVCALFLGGSPVAAADTTTAAPVERIGVYDSRVVAYAHFWSEAYQRGLHERMAAAKAAKEKGPRELSEKLALALRAEQRRLHLQVFSTAPIDDVLADMKNRVQLIQKETGVTRLVSKWDEATLRQHGTAEKIDVTAMLVRDLGLGEKQQRVAQEIANQEPIPLAKAEAMDKAGKL